jgi:hypothetical protein
MKSLVAFLTILIFAVANVLDQEFLDGTSILDPNTGHIALFGGQPTSSGTFLYQAGTAPGKQTLFQIEHE